jgi:hypothetical protein
MPPGSAPQIPGFLRLRCAVDCGGYSFFEAHPVLGWISEGIFFSLLLWVYLRMGFLAGIVMCLTEWTLDTVPLTTNFSAWYAGNGLALAAFFLALAAFGFYTSQAGRPIFQDATRARSPN